MISRGLMEFDKQSRLFTMFNDEYIKMVTKSVSLRQEPLPPINNNVKFKQKFKCKRDLMKKLRKFVSRDEKVPQKGIGNVVETIEVMPKPNPEIIPDIPEVDALELNEQPKVTPIMKCKTAKIPKADNPKKSKVTNRKSWVMKDICWWEPPEESLPLDFCRDTSLHGLKYIGQSQRHLSERIFWLIAFLCGLILAIVLISDVWTKYNTSPIIVSFQSVETTVDQIPFPAVTICNMNKVLKTKADSYIKMATAERVGPSAADAFYLHHVCSATKSFTKKFNFSHGRGDVNPDLFENEYEQEDLTKVNEFLRKASQNCSDMIPLCLWKDEIYNCSHLFRPIETEFGKCCSFNMVPQSVLYTLRDDERDDQEEINQWHQWNLNDGLLLSGYENEFPRRQMQAGKTFGLSFLLNPALDEYFCTTSDSIGFRMATHLSVDVPHVTDFGISIRPKAEVFVNVKPEITMVDQNIFQFPLASRRCYKVGEYSLKYYKYYTPTNCVDECIANATMDICGCKRYYMPRDETQSLCGGNQTSFECAESVKLNATKYGVKNSCTACYPSCTEVNYQSQTTTTPLQTGIWMNSLNESSRWATENVSIVHVFFGEDSTYARVRKEIFGSTDLFANTGGLMGLCLGFSGLSLMEVIYFLTLRAWWTAQRKKNIGKVAITKLKNAWARTKALRQNRSPTEDVHGPRPQLGSGLLDPTPPTYSHVVEEMARKNEETEGEPNQGKVRQQTLDYKTVLGNIL